MWSLTSPPCFLSHWVPPLPHTPHFSVTFSLCCSQQGSQFMNEFPYSTITTTPTSYSWGLHHTLLTTVVTVSVKHQQRPTDIITFPTLFSYSTKLFIFIRRWNSSCSIFDITISELSLILVSHVSSSLFSSEGWKWLFCSYFLFLFFKFWDDIPFLFKLYL
jgi:hypothetical protein